MASGARSPMRMHALILAALAVPLAAGCGVSSISGCDPPEEQFSVDAAQLTEAEVMALQNDGIIKREALECNDVCDFVYRRDREWEATDFTTCELEIDDERGATPETVVGAVTCTGRGIEYYCEGRRPIGHVEARPGGGDPLADHFALCAHLEAASIVAFTQLAGRLTAWGAPAALVLRCERAAAEEAVHAALLTGLARRAGASVPPALQRVCTVDLFAAALDNAVEGCVHEAWSALRAAWIARHADSDELRAVYREIADDEADHAQLAWDLHAWFLGQVTAEQRAQLRRAQQAAIAGLPALARQQAQTTPGILGLPDDRTGAVVATRFADLLEQAA